MKDHELIERIAIQAMNGFLSDPHFFKLMLRHVKCTKADHKKSDRFFDLISFYSCQLAESLAHRLCEARRMEKPKKK